MKIKNKLLIFLSFLTLFIPISVVAYSNEVVLGGENVGIEITSAGIIVVGFYQVDGVDINSANNIRIGDRIIKVDKKDVATIDEMVKEIDRSLKNDQVNLTLLRKNKKINTTLNIKMDGNGIYKTGLYVKDKVTGIGTLTYIDPSTSIYGALGHEIIEGYSNTKVEIKDGKIFSSEVTGINKSTSEKTGEKEADLNEEIVYGDIDDNTESGIYGTYTGSYDQKHLIEVAKSNEIEEGEAYIYTVVNGNKKKNLK